MTDLQKKQPDMDPELLDEIKERFSGVRQEPFMEYLLKTVIEYMMEKRGRDAS